MGNKRSAGELAAKLNRTGAGQTESQINVNQTFSDHWESALGRDLKKKQTSHYAEVSARGGPADRRTRKSNKQVAVSEADSPEVEFKWGSSFLGMIEHPQMSSISIIDLLFFISPVQRAPQVIPTGITISMDPSPACYARGIERAPTRVLDRWSLSCRDTLERSTCSARQSISGRRGIKMAGVRDLGIYS